MNMIRQFFSAGQSRLSGGRRNSNAALQRRSLAWTWRERLAADASRIGPVRERPPEQLAFRRGGEQRIALAAESAVELGLGRQRADFRLAARRQQCQPSRARSRASRVRYSPRRPGRSGRRSATAAPRTAGESRAVADRLSGYVESGDRQLARLARATAPCMCRLVIGPAAAARAPSSSCRLVEASALAAGSMISIWRTALRPRPRPASGYPSPAVFDVAVDGVTCQRAAASGMSRA